LLQSLRELTEARATRVLIIDDDERDRYLLKQEFLDSDVVIQEATEGMDGIREAAKERPNAIILDLTMPGLSGFEVLDALKTNVATKDIPVVICTSRVLSDSERVQLAGKTAAILSKERLGRAEIAETIRRAVADRRIPSAAI
jgi:CheY-like chemotaxis protein